MANFIKRNAAKLRTAALIFMLVIPFLLYAAALNGSAFQVKLLLALMVGNMLFVINNG